MNSMESEASPRAASLLFSLTIVATMAGVFLAILLYFSDRQLSVRTATFFLVGIVGTLSFIRHSVCYRSDQARMGWFQERPEFQIEVGFGNLALAVPALAASLLAWGPLASGMMLLSYGVYILCTLGLHIRNAAADPAKRNGAGARIGNSAFFAASLLVFAALAFSLAG
jgi:hypothetical protein